MERNKRKLEEDDDNNDQSNAMEDKKRKLEEDDHNNDQVSEPITSALNPVVISEAGSGSRTDEDSGVEQQQLVVASNQALSYQLAPGFDPIFNRAPSMYQLQPHFGSLNQPASSSTPSFNPGQLLQQPRHGSLNQPGSSSIPAVYLAPLYQLQPHSGSLNQPASSSTPSFNPGQLLQQPRHGSLNQPESSSIPAVYLAPLHQLQPPRGTLNEPESSSTPSFNPGQLLQQPRHGSLNQPESSSIPAVYLAPLHQLQPPRGTLNEPESSSIPAGYLVPLHYLMWLTSQQFSNLSVWDRYMLGLVYGLSANIQNLNAELYAMRAMGQTVGSTNVLPAGAFQGGGDYRSQLQAINAELNLMQTQRRESMENMTNCLASVDPMPCIVSSHQGGGSTSSNVLFSRAQDDKNKGHSDDAKLPVVHLDQGTRSGPGSTSGNATAGGESEGPVNTAAGDMLSATDADEKQGEEENADTSQDGTTRGSSSAR